MIDPLRTFLRESLRIEGIVRAPKPTEMTATRTFLIEPLSLSSVLALQAVYAPGYPLRSKPGMNVRIGNYLPVRGGPDMAQQLDAVLEILDPWEGHIAFEKLHPFMDGNGRTGRAVWAKLMAANGHNPFALPFLHRFYYQTLASTDRGAP